MIELTGIDETWDYGKKKAVDEDYVNTIYTFKLLVDPTLISSISSHTNYGGKSYINWRDNSSEVLETIEEVEAKINAWYNGNG